MPRNAHDPNNLLIARVGDFLEVALLEEALLVVALHGEEPLVAEPLSRNPIGSIIEACGLALNLLTAQP